MKIAIMQPYFLPYLGYFSLISQVDKFILLDTVQFIRHGWIERNRILKPGGGWQYIKVPLEKSSQKTLIKNMRIRNENWRNKIFAQLEHYKKKSPYYKQTIELITEALNINTDSIVELNHHSLSVFCDYLNINTPIEIFSKMNIKIDKVNSPDEWALNISKALNANTYYNPPGGRDIFDRKKFEKNNINLIFSECNLPEYQQKGNCFESGLSIIDVFMFNPLEEIQEYLRDITLSYPIKDY